MKLAIVAVLAALTLAACGSSGSDGPAKAAGQSEADVKTGGLGTYMATTAEGATVSIDLTGKAMTNKAILDTQAIARKAGVSDPTFITADVDNTDGTDQAGPTELRIVTKDGKTITGTYASDAVGTWMDALDDDDTTTYNQAVAASNALADQEAVLPGAKGSTLFVFDEPIPSIKRVFLDGEEVSLK